MNGGGVCQCDGKVRGAGHALAVGIKHFKTQGLKFNRQSVEQLDNQHRGCDLAHVPGRPIHPAPLGVVVAKHDQGVVFDSQRLWNGRGVAQHGHEIIGTGVDCGERYFFSLQALQSFQIVQLGGFAKWKETGEVKASGRRDVAAV